MDNRALTRFNRLITFVRMTMKSCDTGMLGIIFLAQNYPAKRINIFNVGQLEHLLYHSKIQMIDDSLQDTVHRRISS